MKNMHRYRAENYSRRWRCVYFWMRLMRLNGYLKGQGEMDIKLNLIKVGERLISLKSLSSIKVTVRLNTAMQSAVIVTMPLAMAFKTA